MQAFPMATNGIAQFGMLKLQLPNLTRIKQSRIDTFTKTNRIFLDKAGLLLLIRRCEKNRLFKSKKASYPRQARGFLYDSSTAYLRPISRMSCSITLPIFIMTIKPVIIIVATINTWSALLECQLLVSLLVSFMALVC
jgi:hypothetical protein